MAASNEITATLQRLRLQEGRFLAIYTGCSQSLFPPGDDNLPLPPLTQPLQTLPVPTNHAQNCPQFY
jgi:hypothetical protein